MKLLLHTSVWHLLCDCCQSLRLILELIWLFVQAPIARFPWMGTFRKMSPSPADYTYTQKESDDDHSYFVRWKLPTEALWSLTKSNGLTELCLLNHLLQQPRYPFRMFDWHCMRFRSYTASIVDEMGLHCTGWWSQKQTSSGNEDSVFSGRHMGAEPGRLSKTTM